MREEEEGKGTAVKEEAKKEQVKPLPKNKRIQNFSKKQISFLRKWFFKHIEHPYLKDEDKTVLSSNSGLTKV